MMGDVEESLLALPKEQLLKRCLKQITQAQKDLQQKDRLIADLSKDKEKTNAERERILQYAREEAETITAKARTEAEEMLGDAERKITNAQIEADSIIKTALSQAKEDIEALEHQRDETKRSAMSCLTNTVSEFDVIIAQIEERLGALKDARRTVLEAHTIIEHETFNRFDIADYVGSDGEPIQAETYDGIDEGLIDDEETIDAADYAALSVLLDDAVDAESPELQYEDQEESSGRVAEWISVPTIAEELPIEDDFGQCEFVDTQDDGEEDSITFDDSLAAEETYYNEEQTEYIEGEYQEEYYEEDESQSFTDSFMSLSDLPMEDVPYDEQQPEENMVYQEEAEEDYDPYADMEAMSMQTPDAVADYSEFGDFADLEVPPAEAELEIPDKKAAKVAAMQGRWLS